MAAEVWQPFLENGKWGFIDATGAWRIPPHFDHAFEAFTGESVRAGVKGKIGLLARDSRWLIEPRCSDLFETESPPGCLIATIGGKEGLYTSAGREILPPKYDEIVLSRDSAWVRDGDTLGLSALDGKWIAKPSLPWPRKRDMPWPLNADGVAWFTQRDKWGLLSKDCRILFPARFESHIPGRKEAEDWDHPEGADFVNGRAWVVVGGKYLLITSGGEVLTRQDFASVRPWSADTFLYTIERPGQARILYGLVGRNGNLALPAAPREIEQPHEGFAKITDNFSFQKPNGEWSDYWSEGLVDDTGRIVEAVGRYEDIGPFSEGLGRATATAYEPGAGHGRTGFLDTNGEVAIAFRYERAEPFSEGLAAVQLHRPGSTGSYVRDFYYGYIDKTGKTVIAPEFEHVTSFCKGRAWVAPQGTWGGSYVDTKWAMIDRTGKRLTDWAYDPPETIDHFYDPAPDWLTQVRWRGDLVVLARRENYGLLGLATADGKVILEPTYHEIGDFHDGLARVRSFKKEENFYGFIDQHGKLVVPVEYTDATDFDHGVAWVTRQSRGKSGPENEGWQLIDRTGKILTDRPLLAATWVGYEPHDYSRYFPVFMGGFAGVVEPPFLPYGKNNATDASWGYIDRTGRHIIWHEAPAKHAP